MFEYNLEYNSAALIFAASKLNLPHRWSHMSFYLSNYFRIAYHSLFHLYFIAYLGWFAASSPVDRCVHTTPGSKAATPTSLNPGCCWLRELWGCLVTSWWVWFPALLLPAFPYNVSTRTWNQIRIRILPACLSDTRTAAMSSGFGAQSVYNPVGTQNFAELDSFVPVGVQQI